MRGLISALFGFLGILCAIGGVLTILVFPAQIILFFLAFVFYKIGSSIDPDPPDNDVGYDGGGHNYG